MKRVFKLSLFVCAILFSTVATASDVFSVKIENASIINVSLSNISKGQKLYLKDYSGNIMYDMTLTTMDTYKKYFDFSTVENGVYFVETETEFEVKITPVLKNHKGIALINDSATTIFKPKTLVEDSMVKVMLNRIKKSALNIYIYDLEGVMLFNEKVQDDVLLFERTYDFSTVPSGKYIIYFALDDRTFKKEINI